MNAQDIRNLQEAYMEVYRELDEDWKPVNVPKVKSRMGNLEGRLSSVSNDRFSSNTPEYARYQRTADVVSQSTRNPNKPFQKPTPDPGGMKIKPGGGVTSSPERNSQWQPFSSRLPTKTPATVTKPSGGGMGGARGGGSSPGSVKPAAKPSTPSSTTPNPRSISGSSAPRPGRGSTSNWMTDRMGEFTSSLNRLSKPNSTTKPQVKPTKSSRGGGSSAQGLGSSSGTRGYQVGGSPGYGISGIKLADSYDRYDIILSHLLDEGYAETPEAAEAIMVNMGEEWRESIMEMDDFAAGGGNAKIKETGMNKDQVIALGKKNLANVAKKQTPQQPQSSSQPSQVPAPTSNSRTFKSGYEGKSAIRGKIERLRDDEELDALQQKRNQRWAKNELRPGPSGIRSIADVDADRMRSQGQDWGIDPKETEKSIKIVMDRRRRAAAGEM